MFGTTKLVKISDMCNFYLESRNKQSLRSLVILGDCLFVTVFNVRLGIDFQRGRVLIVVERIIS